MFLIRTNEQSLGAHLDSSLFSRSTFPKNRNSTLVHSNYLFPSSLHSPLSRNPPSTHQSLLTPCEKRREKKKTTWNPFPPPSNLFYTAFGKHKRKSKNVLEDLPSTQVPLSVGPNTYTLCNFLHLDSRTGGIHCTHAEQLTARAIRHGREKITLYLALSFSPGKRKKNLREQYSPRRILPIIPTIETGKKALYKEEEFMSIVHHHHRLPVCVYKYESCVDDSRWPCPRPLSSEPIPLLPVWEDEQRTADSGDYDKKKWRRKGGCVTFSPSMA